ncbi:MAG TPA: serine/threonine-protein kinase [Gemmatimonadaceae bacterium]
MLQPMPTGMAVGQPLAPSSASPTTLERDEVRRMVARSMRIGMWVWPAFTVVDAWMCFVAFPGAPFGLFLVYRVVIELALIAVYRSSRRLTVSTAVLRLSQNVTFTAIAVTIALMAVSLGGIRSSYMHGISIVALVRAAVFPEPWRMAWPGFAGIAAAFPVVMAIVAGMSPALRADWFTGESFVIFASNYVFVLSSATIGLVTSNIMWQAEQRVYRARRVGRYRLLAPIGKGGMGEVWLAWDSSLQRNVALKLLRAMSDTEPDLLARFEREALAASRLQSPHVIQIFDYGASDDGLYYIAMEYLTGRDLGTVVKEDGPLATGRAVDFMLQACLALEVAHAAGVIHRDIKPENLFLARTDSGEIIKLLDFGIVRFREPTGSNLTWTGVLVGTPLYLAPELWTGSPADDRSDVYALGVTMYFLLTGRLPFAERDWTGRGALAPIFPNPSPCEASIDDLVRHCLRPDPAQRVPSARAFRDRLDICRQALEASRSWTPA